MTKLIVAFHNFANMLKNCYSFGLSKKMHAFCDTTVLKLEAADVSETLVLIYETTS
jgi:hypothetical protein